jgi:hypothetical protein
LEYTTEHSYLRFRAGNIFLFSKRSHQLRRPLGVLFNEYRVLFPRG